MTLKSYSRLELAENQLRVAIALFVSGGDRFSVISLAGAADVILCRLVQNSGQENFTEALLKEAIDAGAVDRTLESHGKEINDVLFINQLKHLDGNDEGYLEMDPEECAIGAILKALANYVKIADRNKDFVQAFFAWVRLNLDPKKYDIHGAPDWTPEADAAHKQ